MNFSADKQNNIQRLSVIARERSDRSDPGRRLTGLLRPAGLAMTTVAHVTPKHRVMKSLGRNPIACVTGATFIALLLPVLVCLAERDAIILKGSKMKACCGSHRLIVKGDSLQSLQPVQIIKVEGNATSYEILVDDKVVIRIEEGETAVGRILPAGTYRVIPALRGRQRRRRVILHLAPEDTTSPTPG